MSGALVDSEKDASANARIWKALEEPVSMRIPLDTALDDVLKHIQDATRRPDGTGIPIYIDPLGTQTAEKALTSSVSIDLEGVPLRTTLRLCLGQVGLRYEVRDGILRITSVYDAIDLDPFEIVGRCLLALLAAGLGGVLAPLVSDLRPGAAS